MKCPICRLNDGQKQKDNEGFWWFVCPKCGFRCSMSQYRGRLAELAEKDRLINEKLEQEQQEELKED